MLEIKNLSKTVKNKIILKNINLTCRSGQITFLLGESGVGKSTLLRILNNLETYDTGSIILDDKKLESNNRHKNIGMVFQHFSLFKHLTVEQNITLVLEKVYNKSSQQAHNIAQELLTKYKLENKAQSYINSLSGGEKQRLAIARTLATDPYVICLDEPTSALDPLFTNQVAINIQKLANENRIVIVSTHDMNLVINNNLEGTVYLMKNGSIIESASTQDIKTNIEKFKELSNFVSGNIR